MRELVVVINYDSEGFSNSREIDNASAMNVLELMDKVVDANMGFTTRETISEILVICGDCVEKFYREELWEHQSR